MTKASPPSSAAPIALLDGLPLAPPIFLVETRRAARITQREAAALVGLSNHVRWSEYERGIRPIPLSLLALFLLSTGQHPAAKALRRRPTA